MNEPQTSPETPAHEDIVLWVLDALDADEAQRVKQAVEADAARTEQAAQVRAHVDLYDAMPDAPPPPSFERITLQTRADTRHNFVLLAVAASIFLAVGVGIWALFPKDSPTEQTTAVVARSGWSWTFGDGRPHQADDTGVIWGVRRGVLARTWNGPAELRWQSGGRGVHLIASSGTAIRWVSAETIEIERGHAWFEVEPARSLEADDFRVRFGDHTVRVVGTVFVVDANQGRVEVVRGQVEVDGAGVSQDQRWAKGAVTAHKAAPIAWLPKAMLELGREAGRGEDVFLLTFRNPSAVTVRLPAPPGNRTGLWMEWLDKQGQRLKSLPIPPQALEGDRKWLWEGQDVDLPPGGERTVWIRFRAAERPAGAYRCRALVRPAGAPPVLSNPLGLEER